MWIIWIFFWQKQNDIHSFTLIEYIRINIAKSVKDESANKLTSPKLIAYNGKMPTKNMMKSKSPEYSCFRICNVGVQIMDWICDWLNLIFQYEPNEHRNKARNQTTPHKTTNNTTPHSDDEIMKKQKRKHLIYVEITYLDWKKREKWCKGGDSRSKNDLKPPLLDEWKRKKT